MSVRSLPYRASPLRATYSLKKRTLLNDDRHFLPNSSPLAGCFPLCPDHHTKTFTLV